MLVLHNVDASCSSLQENVARRFWLTLQGFKGHCCCRADLATATAVARHCGLRPCKMSFFFGKKLEETSNTLKEPKLPMFQLCFERISTFRICQEVKSGPSPEAKPTIHKETQTFDNHIIYIF
jgi:hypothetical protein